MISFIRRKFKAVGFKIILWVTLISLGGLFTLPELIRLTKREGTWVAQVNGEKIDYDDFTHKVIVFQEQLRAFRAQYGQYADFLLQSMGLSLNPKSLALDSLVRETLLNAVAYRIPVYIHPDYKAEKLSDPHFIVQELSEVIPLSIIDSVHGINRVSRAFRSYLQGMKLTMADFEKMVNQGLQRQFALKLAEIASYTPEFEVMEQYIADNVRKKFSLLTFSFDQFLKQEKATKVSQEELKEFFDRKNIQTKQYWVPEKRSGLIWKFEPQNYGITITDEEIEAYYNDNKSKQFVEKPSQTQVRRILFTVDNDESAVREQAEKVREDLLQDPTQFAEIAQKVSADKETASKGGLLPFFKRGEKEKEFEKAAFFLINEGDISDIVRTEEGFEILQLVERKKPAYKPIQKVRSEIKDKLVQKRFNELFVEDMRQVLDQMNINEDALEDFIREKGGKAERVDSLTEGPSKLAKILFRLKENEASFYSEGKTGVAVKLTEIKERYLPMLDSIKDVVLNDLYEERATKKFVSCLEEAKQGAAQQSFEELQKIFDAHYERTEWIKSDDTEELRRLEMKGIPPAKIFQLAKPGSMISYKDDKHGFLIRLDELEPVDAEHFATKKDDIVRELEKKGRRFFVGGFVASLHRNATIKVHESLMKITEI